MTEQIGILFRKKFDVGAVGVGEGVKRQALRRARQELIDAGYFARENGVPPFEKMGIGEVNAEGGAQARKERRIADLTLFVAPI